MTREEKEARRLFRALKPFDLPIGVYLVTREGRFLECDRRVREILKLPLEGPPDASILDFYRNPADRECLIRKTEEAEARGGYLERELIGFQVEGREVFVRDYCRPLRDRVSNTIVGFVGCLVDVTEEERYQRLFECLPAGVYQLDADDRLVRVNEALVRMFGYASRAEMEGCSVRELYRDPEDADALRVLVQKEGRVVKHVEELVKKSGEIFLASISAFQVTAPDGSYAGREGTLVDVTTQERYRRMLNYVPVGFYEVRLDQGQDIISGCNEQFARMFDFESPEDVVGTRILELYANEEDHPRFLAEIRAREERGQPLLGFTLRVVSRLGRRFAIEVNSRLLRDRSGAVVGRTGVVRDVTDEVALRERYEKLLSDVGRVLHPFSPTLLMVQLSLESLKRALGSDPFEGSRAPTLEEADVALARPVACLVRSLGKLLALADSERVSTALPREKWEELSRLLELFREYQYVIPIESRPSALRDASRKVIDICTGIPRGVVARDPVRQLRGDAQALERLTCHVDLYLIRTAILQTDHQVRALRDFVTAGARVEEPRSACRLSDLVGEAVQRLAEFAKNQGVEIEQRHDYPRAQVEAVERDVVRALTNLLHNAIKYSWHPATGDRRWVTVGSTVVGNDVQVVFENYGVPITREEIEQELIFQVGYRGRMSRDRGRLGTGIGLTDARSVAHSHGGDVTVDSRPASSDRAADDYSAPFLTTATLILPLYRKEYRS